MLRQEATEIDSVDSEMQYISANKKVSFCKPVCPVLVQMKVFQIEAGWFLKFHLRNSLILQGFLSRNVLSCYFITLRNA